ncbi:hypothetical protein BRC93_07845 [Halobacteriales archaeon QS_5_70_15]|nr:MAG: hypothetical protein BRC93_07845 [Halobacteriales archaeon QS_5_70_15]
MSDGAERGNEEGGRGWRGLRVAVALCCLLAGCGAGPGDTVRTDGADTLTRRGPDEPDEPADPDRHPVHRGSTSSHPG